MISSLVLAIFGYQISRSPSCMFRLPPLNWWLLRNKLPDVTKIYPALSGFAFVTWSSVPLFEGSPTLKLR